MQKSILVLPDGTELSSGRGTTNALMNVQYTEMVNSGTELTVGSVCASCIEATLIAPSGNLSIAAETEITVYTEYDDGTREQTGIFRLEKPTRSSANAYKLIAFDNVIKLDMDVTSWLTTQLPKTLFELTKATCEKCGVTLENEYIPHGDIVIREVPTGDITGRKVLQWAAEIGACFAKATPQGTILFSWYSKNQSVMITPGVENSIEKNCIPFFGGSLSYEDYQVSQVEKVQIRNATDDIGIVWPPDVDQGNTYIVDGNGLLMSCSSDELQYVAQGIYQALMNFTYVPCKVSIPRSSGIKTGDIVEVIDANGATFNTCIMTKTISGGKEKLESSGSHTRNSSTAINSKEYSDLEKKVLKLNMSVDGIKILNENLAGQYSKLELTVEGIEKEVGDAQDNITKILQTAGEVSVIVADDEGALSSIINKDTWEIKYIDENGEEVSGLYFDPLKKQFLFNGSGKFTGSINVNDNFIVDENGKAILKSAELYKGSPENDDYVRMYLTESGVSIMRGLFESSIRIIAGRVPQIEMIAANSAGVSIKMIKNYINGMWIGNSYCDTDDDGRFVENEESNGLFIDEEQGEVFVVTGKTRKKLYTGDHIARFG